MPKPKRSNIMGRMNIETWTPDFEKLRERLAPSFDEKKPASFKASSPFKAAPTRKEPLQWPKKPE